MKQIPKSTNQIFPNADRSMLTVLQYVVLICLVLYFGKTLFIPLSFSLLISFILFPICKWMEKKGITKTLAILISLSFVLVLMGTLLYLLFIQINEFSHEWEPFRKKLLDTLSQISVYIAQRFQISTEEQLTFFRNSINSVASQALSFLRNTAYLFSETFFYLLIIPVFSALILYHRQILANVLYLVFPAERQETIREILTETIHAYYNFIKGMLVVYLIVGTLNSIGLAIVGVPHPVLFGFIASILTFIPYIGILISSLLPIAVSWITFNSIWYPLGVIIVFSIVQILEAYVIFPFAVGSRLKINTLVIMIMITAGGILWGAAGMILFIPFASIAKLIADRTESLKILSILLGDGEHQRKK
ncbi:MAG: putative PurR-regulated permease PerM [Flavobacterium sp.]|jgi:predicted PurR-regulated permease PerM